MPRKPYQEYTTDYDTLMNEAKASLGRADALERERDQDIQPYQEPEAPESLWGKVKRLSHWSPAGDRVPSEELRAENQRFDDKKALAGEPLSTVDTVRNFAEPTLGFLGDAAKNLMTPGGVATALPMGRGASIGSRVVGGLGSLIFGAEGAETAIDSNLSGRDRALGGLNALLGATGLYHGVKGGPRPRPVVKEGVSRPVSPRDMWNADPIEPPPPPPPGPTRHPNDLWDTPGYQNAPDPVPSPDLAPSPVTAKFLGHQDDFEGGSIPLYNIEGGLNHGSTVSATSLTEQGIAIPETPPFVPRRGTNVPEVGTKPRLTVEDTLGMFKGREKFDAANPDVTTASGVRDSLDRSGVEYGRTQRELKRLLKMEDADPRDLAQHQQGARELGSRLRAEGKAAIAPPVQESGPFINNEQPISVANDAPDLSTLSHEELGVGRQFPGEDVNFGDVDINAGPIDLDQAWQTAAADMDTGFVRESSPDLMAMLKGSTPDAPLPASKAMKDLGDPRIRAQMDKARTYSDRLDESKAATQARIEGARTPTPESTFLNDAGEPIVNPRGDFAAEDPSPLSDLLSNEKGEVNFGPGLAKLGDQLTSNPSPETLSKMGAAYQGHQAASLLFSPITVGKIGISNTVSALQKSAERAADTGSMDPVKNLLRELLNGKQLWADAKQAFKNPNTQASTRLDPSRAPLPTTGLRGLLSSGSRAVGAMDTPFRNAMKRAGFSDFEALTTTQQRTPVTEFGRSVTGLQNNQTGRNIIPFIKSKVNQFEEGLLEPAKAANRIRTGEMKPSDAVKLLSAAGFGTAAYASQEQIDRLPIWARPLALSAAGIAAPAASIGYALAKAPAGIKAVWDAIIKQTPLGEGVLPDSSNLVNSTMGRVIPRSLNPDYWTGTKRETDGVLEQMQASVPGLAQLLNVKSQPRTRAKRAPRARR